MKNPLPVLFVFLWASATFGLALNRYPYESNASPKEFASMTPAQLARAKKLTTDFVQFLFISSCDPADKSRDLCLWAYVHTLFPSDVFIERDGPTITLYRVAKDEDGKVDWKRSRQFVSVLQLNEAGEISTGTSVNGKTLVATHWVTPQGQELAVPMVWLPVTLENQKRIDGECYQGLRTSPGKEVRLLFSDLLAGPSQPGQACFVILGFEMADPAEETLYFVARKHAQEADTFTATLKRAHYRTGEGIPDIFDWRGFLFLMKGAEPSEFRSILLEEGSSAQGKITAR